MLNRTELEQGITAHQLLQSANGHNAFEAMHVYKQTVRSVAAQARNIILEQEHLPDSADCILTSCSRVVFQNDVLRA
eukprot:6764237-Karenia_brevis.AAC.1